MLISSLATAEQYYALHPLLRTLFKYVRTHDLLPMPAGRITLQGDELYINVNDAVCVADGERPFEAHRQYLDVHIPLSGAETRRWKPVSKLGDPYQAYDAAADCALWTATDDSLRLTIEPGMFCIDFPDDAHAPALGDGETLRKLIAKVRI